MMLTQEEYNDFMIWSQMNANQKMNFHDSLPREWRDLCNEFPEAIYLYNPDVDCESVKSFCQMMRNADQKYMLMSVA